MKIENFWYFMSNSCVATSLSSSSWCMSWTVLYLLSSFGTCLLWPLHTQSNWLDSLHLENSCSGLGTSGINVYFCNIYNQYMFLFCMLLLYVMYCSFTLVFHDTKIFTLFCGLGFLLSGFSINFFLPLFVHLHSEVAHPFLGIIILFSY